MLQADGDLFAQQDVAPPIVRPWRPRALNHTQWPPDYAAVYAWRMKMLVELQNDATLLAEAEKYYNTRPNEFIMDWMDTYDPRKALNHEVEELRGPKWMPFVFFERQDQFITFLHECRLTGESGLNEKSRDMGSTWGACAYSVWSWRFIDHDAIGWGSRKQELVDRKGDASSIFEKIRLLIRRLPAIWRPKGLTERDHLKSMNIMNPENGASIIGEIGDGIGRGGRTAMYFCDEAQPYDARILTPFGWQTMGDMFPGSLIIGADGNSHTVTHINDCGIHSVYRVTFSDGTSTEASHNHLWNVEKVHGKREKKTLRTCEIAEKFRYESPGGQIQYRYRIPSTKPVRFIPRGGEYPLHPYIVGVLLGDGSVNSGSVSFTSADVEIVANVVSRLPEGCRVTKGTGSYTYRIVDVRGRMGNKEYNRSRARKAVRLAGIAAHLSYQKFIPDHYKFGSIDDRLEILQGLMDTDGSASGNATTFHTSSVRLMEDVRFIVQSLGGVASLSIRPDHRGYRDMYVLHVRLPEYMNLFKLTRKLKLCRNRQPHGKTIISVDFVGIKPVRCITVNNSDGLYLTDHCIVTHNSAHYEHPELVEAALGDNTTVRIDISSVNGVGNVFHRRREAGMDWYTGHNIPSGYVRVFVTDWSDHPNKNQEWHDKRRAKYEREGMLHIFEQETNRNYSAALSNTIIPYEWLVACVDAHIHIPYFAAKPIPAIYMAGLDVADEGIDRNALAIRQWIILRSIEEWGERDVGSTTRRAVIGCRPYPGIALEYDCIGVGSGVKSEYNRLRDDKIITQREIRLIPWNAGAGVVDPFEAVIPDDDQSPLNEAMFYNMKAQAWWSFRTRVYKTYRARMEGAIYPVDELCSIDGRIPLVQQLLKELAQAVRKTNTALKTIVDKQPPGTKSPNLGDATIMAFFPAPEDTGRPIIGGMRT